MPKMSKDYCLKTSPKKMGFSQKSSCKAQGFIKRTSKKYKGKFVISPKYRFAQDGSHRLPFYRFSFQRSKTIVKSSIKKKSKTVYKNISLFSSGKNKIKSGYGSGEIAEQTLKNLKGYPKEYKMQIVNTMYNRAKYHKYQTKGMRDAMRVYRKWLKNV